MRRIAVAVLSLLVAATLAVAVRWYSDPTVREKSGPDWRELAGSTAVWLEQGAVEKLREAEDLLREHTYDAETAESYAETAFHCAQGRRQGAYGDALGLLYRADAALRSAGERVAPAVWVGLAREYTFLRCFRTALETLDAMPESVQDEDADRLRRQLGTILGILGERVPVPLRRASDGTAPVVERLLDLFGVFPLNGWYDVATFLDESGGSEHLPAARYTEAGSYLHDERHARLPLLSRVLQPDAAPFSDEVPDAPGTLELTNEEEAELLALAARVKGAAPGDTMDLTGLVCTPELAKRGFETDDMPVESGNEIEIDVGIVVPGGIVFASHYDWNSCTLLIHLEGEKATAHVLPFLSRPTLVLRDLTGDGRLELIASARRGSGGFVDAYAVGLWPARFVLFVEDLHKGGLTFVDVDADPSLEILATLGTDDQIVGCGQCPRPFLGYLLDYDEGERRYHVASRRVTATELLMRAHNNLAGVGPHMYLETLRKEVDLPRLLEELGRSDASSWSRESLVEEYGVVLEFARRLQELQAFEEASQVLAGFTAALEREDASEFGRSFRAFVHITHMNVWASAPDPERALALAGESWFRKILTVDSDLRVQTLVTAAVCHHMTGRLGEEFENLDAALRERPGHRVILGNLAMYFNTIGDYTSAETAGLEALDAAVRDEDWMGQTIDMAHLAAAAFHQGRDRDALDWLVRAIPWARAASTGSLVTAIMSLAADLALKIGEPEIALGLLDEAILTCEETVWKTHGGSTLLLYAMGLQRLGRTDMAIECLKASCKLAAPVDSGIHATAAYELARLERARGDVRAALRWASDAFAAVSSGRRRIGMETHKFSFLAPRKKVLEFLLQLLVETEADPSRCREALDGWKMRTFLDIYSKSGVGDRDADRAIAVRLDPNIVLLDYFIGDELALVVAYRGGTDIAVTRLPITLGELEGPMGDVMRELDVHDPDALAAIRSRELPASLSTPLQRLHDVLLAPVDLPPDVDLIMVAPDESMFGIPWPALMPDPSSHLVDRCACSLVPSATMAGILLERERPPAPAKACVIGSIADVRTSDLPPWVDVDERAGVALPGLSFGERECREVGRILGRTHRVRYFFDREVDSLESSPANPTEVLRALEDCRIAHLVAHGLYNPRDPMRSCVFVGEGKGSRTIEAKDLAGLDLSALDWICLAACRSGTSGARPGAEPIGFVRALLGAGASSIVVTEWEVDDSATFELLRRTYESMAHLPRAESLRQARLEAKARLPHPYFWAGITLYGDPR